MLYLKIIRLTIFWLVRPRQPLKKFTQKTKIHYAFPLPYFGNRTYHEFLLKDSFGSNLFSGPQFLLSFQACNASLLFLGKSTVNYKLALFLSTCMSFLTQTRWFAFICNHCSLQNTGKWVITITAILPRGKLRPRKVKWLTQRHTVNWWQSQDWSRESSEVAYCSTHPVIGLVGWVFFFHMSRFKSMWCAYNARFE